jgi:hypothetical protein
MGKKLSRLKKPNTKAKFRKKGLEKMEHMGNRELKTVVSLLHKLQQFKVKVIENLTMLTQKNTSIDNDGLVGYEVLMKEYYQHSADRILEEAEEALLLANEAEESFRKTNEYWSEY